MCPLTKIGNNNLSTSERSRHSGLIRYYLDYSWRHLWSLLMYGLSNRIIYSYLAQTMVYNVKKLNQKTARSIVDVTT